MEVVSRRAFSVARIGASVATVLVLGSGLRANGAVLFSDDFERTPGALCNSPVDPAHPNRLLGAMSNFAGGSGTHAYNGIKGADAGAGKVVGATLDGGSVLNANTAYGGGGFEVTTSNLCPNSGASIGDNLNLQASVLVPSQAHGGSVGLYVCDVDATIASVYFRTRRAFTGDGVRGGAASGFRVELDSLGQVRVLANNTGTYVATAARPSSFDASLYHTLLTSVQGSPGTLRIVLDGRLTVLRRLSDNALFTTLPLPVTGGTNERATGIEFESDKRGLLAGQRIDNYIVSDAAAVLPCSGACDDGNPCTTNDTCSAGDCSGTPVDCGSEDDACNLGMCDPSTGACTSVPKPNNTACDDGLPGTTGDTCTCGTCIGTCTIDANCDDGSECNGVETCVGGRCVAGTPDVEDCVDHFFCYSAKAAKADNGAPAYPAFVPVEGLTFTDAFGGVAPDQHKLDLKKTRRLCAPADKNGEDPTAPAHTEHLLAYKVGITKTDPKQPKPAKVVKRIDNQLGELRLLVSGNDSVLVPSNKALGDGGAPSLVSPSVDHFRCYKAKVAKAPKGEPAYPEFTPVTVTLSDQFGGPKHYELLKPTLLCNPANKEGEDPTAPSHIGHLVCYKAKLSKLDPPQTPFATLRVSTNNQLGQEVLDVKKVDRLCIPSLRID